MLLGACGGGDDGEKMPDAMVPDIDANIGTPSIDAHGLGAGPVSGEPVGEGACWGISSTNVR